MIISARASGPSSNRLLNYQLRITDSNGIPVADGTQDLKLTIYDAAAAGNQLYTACSSDGTPTGTPTAVQATFSGGIGSVTLGDTSNTCASGSAVALPATLFSNSALYLGVSVGVDPEMTPRKRLLASGYALNADYLDDLDTSAVGGANAYVPVTDGSGNLTITGQMAVGTSTHEGTLHLRERNSVVSLGPNLIADGTFDTACGGANWTCNSPWTISGGVATNAGGSNGRLIHSTTFPVAKYEYYRVVLDITTTTPGNLWVTIGDGSTDAGSASTGYLSGTQNGLKLNITIFTTVASASLNFRAFSGIWTGTIDNVTVQKITTIDPAIVIENSNGRKALEVRVGPEYDFGGNYWSSNIFIGNDSGAAFDTSTAFSNTALGTNAMQSISTGSFNTALGDRTMTQNTSGSYNTALGALALLQNRLGIRNTAVGMAAIETNEGSYNAALGYQALAYAAGTDRSVAIGSDALVGDWNNRFAITGDNNVAVGYQALKNSTSGSNNLALGYRAGDLVTTGTGNILIGYDVDPPLATTSNHLNIGNLIYGDLAGKDIGIGVASPAYTLDLAAVNADNDRAVNLSISADTDGDDVYGIYNAVDVGTGTIAADRNAYGMYNLLTNDATTLGGGNEPIVYGIYNQGTVSSAWGYMSGIRNIMTSSGGTVSQVRGIDNSITAAGDGAASNGWGVLNSITATGNGTVAYGVDNGLNTNADANTQTVYGVRNRLRTYAGASDVAYANYVEDFAGLSTGGTQYGLYMNLDDVDVTNYGVYEAGGATNFFSGNVGVGTPSPNVRLTVGEPLVAMGGMTSAHDDGAVIGITKRHSAFGRAAYIQSIWDPSGNDTGAYGLQTITQTEATNANNVTGFLIGVEGRSEHNGTGTVPDMYGTFGVAAARSNGTTNAIGAYGGGIALGGAISNAYGVKAQNAAYTGSITNSHGVYIDDVWVVSSIANAAGLTVRSQNADSNNTNILIGTATIPTGTYSIYDASSRSSYFSGNVGIGDASPASLFTVGSGDAFRIDNSGNVTTLGDVAVEGGDLTTTTATFNMAAGATTVNIAGGSGSTGCTIDGSGNLACSGTISGSGVAAANVNLSNLSSVAINTDLIPDSDDDTDLGSTSLRWRDLYLGPGTLHIGTSATDEGTVSYDTAGNILNFGTDATSEGDIAFFADDLYLDKSAGMVGIGTTTPSEELTVAADMAVGGHSMFGNMYSTVSASRAVSIWEKSSYAAVPFALSANLDFDPSASGQRAGGVQIQAFTDPTNANSVDQLVGLNVLTHQYGAGDTTGKMFGVLSQMFTQSGVSSNVNWMRALHTEYDINGTGTVANAAGLFVDKTYGTASLVTNNYGIYIADQNAGSSLNYALYYADPSSPFAIDGAGNVGIATAAPAAQLDISYASGATGEHLHAGPANSDFSAGTKSNYLDIALNNISAHNSADGSWGATLQVTTEDNTTNDLLGFGNRVLSDSTTNRSFVVGTYNSVDQNGGATLTELYGVLNETAAQTTVSNLWGVYNHVHRAGLAGSMNEMIGIDTTASTSSAGTVTSLKGLSYALNNAGSSIITNAYGLFIDTPSNSSTITNNYGIYLGDQSAGTTNYAIYSAGGQSYFAGNIGVGTQTPTSRLTVSGGDVLLSDGDIVSPVGGMGSFENFLRFSEQFDNAVWTKTGVTVSATNITAPDGNATAERLSAGAVGTDGVKQAAVSPSMLVSYGTKTWTGSVWLKAQSGTPSVTLVLDAATVSDPGSATVTLSTSWQRYSVTHTFTTGSGYPLLDIRVGTNTVDVWGAQVEYASAPGVYARTQDVLIATSDPDAPARGLVGNGSVLFAGTQGATPTAGEGARMMWVPSKQAFRAGYAGTSTWDDANLGTYSGAFGYATRASGTYSFAGGNQSVASSTNAFAFGAVSTASQFASVAMGSNANATGSVSIAMGGNAYASGGAAIAFGSDVSSSNLGSVVLGTYVNAAADYAFTIGHGAGFANRLQNTVPDSLMVGFNSTVPSLFVGPSEGVGTSGVVAFGTGTPLAKYEFVAGTGASTTSSDISSLGAAGTGSITVGSTAGFPPSGALVVDSEVMAFTKVDGTTFNVTARGRYLTTGTAHTNGATVRFVVRATSKSATTTPHEVLLSTGEYGVGTAVPGSAIEASGTITATTAGTGLALKAAQGGWDTAMIRWRDNTGSNLWSMGNDYVGNGNNNFWLYDNTNNDTPLYIDPTGASYLSFGTTDGGVGYDNGTQLLELFTNGLNRMYVTSSGNVGIGDSTPAALLTVGSGDRFQVNASGDVTSTFTQLDGTDTTNGTGAASTSLVLNDATGFDVGNYVEVNSTDCVTGVNVCYAKITNIVGSTLTISPAISWANGVTVDEFHVPEIGGTDTAQTLANRYGRGYFIDGIVTGNGTTYFTDSGIRGISTFTFDGDLTFGDSSGDSVTFTGTSVSAPNDLDIDAQTLYIDSSTDSVGMGTNAPEARLHIYNGSAGSMTAGVNSDMVIEDDSNVYLSLLSPAGTHRGIVFGEVANAFQGGIYYDNISADGIEFRTNGNTTRMVIDGSGRVGINDTNPTQTLTVGGNIGISDTEVITSGRLFRSADGASSGTAYGFSSSANSGMYLSGSEVRIASAGSDGINVQSDQDVTMPGRLAVGTTAVNYPFTVRQSTATTVFPVRQYEFELLSSGTVGTGFGVELDYLVERADGALTNLGQQEFVWQTATAGVEDGHYKLVLKKSGALDDVMTYAAATGLSIDMVAQRSERLCHSGANGTGQNLAIIGDCTVSGVDFAEYAVVRDAGAEPGDLVFTVGQHPTRPGKTLKALSDRRYQPVVDGVISTNPFLEILGEGQYKDEEGAWPIALMGRIPVKVSLENGEIRAGDPITSSSVRGVAMKASRRGHVIGYAEEDYDGSVPVSAYVAEQERLWNENNNGRRDYTSDSSLWPAGVGKIMVNFMPSYLDLDVMEYGYETASATGPTVDSLPVSFRGFVWDPDRNAEIARTLALTNTVTDKDYYRLSLTSDLGEEIAFFGSRGDIALKGRFYPSDRGALQTSRYIFYDGGSGPLGDFMRTNAAGWATGSYDFAEAFPSDDGLEAGELVMVDIKDRQKVRRADNGSESNAWLLVGVVSTRPGFLAGMNEIGHYPIALQGRVPTKVNLENGPIAIGDPITISSVPGEGMKADGSGYVVGIALEEYDGSGPAGTITVFLKTGWWNGSSVEQPDTSASGTLAAIAEQGLLDMQGYPIVRIGALEGIDGQWAIDGNGRIIVKESVADSVGVRVTDDRQTIGRGTVYAGLSATVVQNDDVAEGSEVFITFRKNPGGNWWISEVHEGMFILQLERETVEDIPFTYWIIDIIDERTPVDDVPDPGTEPAEEGAAPEGQIAPSSEQAPVAQEQAAEEPVTEKVPKEDFSVQEQPAGEDPAAASEAPAFGQLAGETTAE